MNQHRVSSVYLKQWAYRNKNNHNELSVFNKNTNKWQYSLVRSFTAEEDLFDISFSSNEKIRRDNENRFKLPEDHYPNLIKSLDENNRLGENDFQLLTYYLSTLIIRSPSFRDFFQRLLANISTREKVINEICLFQDEDEKAILNQLLQLEILKLPNLNDQINILTLPLMKHFKTILAFFHFVVFECPLDKGWFTSDEPVKIDRKENYTWLVPENSEILFPISPKYFLKMVHPKFDLNHPLLHHQHLSVIKISNDLDIDEIIDGYIRNLEATYIISPMYIPHDEANKDID